ncbi:MAG: ATP synthase F1 subunit gamma [Anaerolineales bacterium]|nr:ATP synthase F1 subunit gamma [Anaerolineales bacterium]
MATERELRKRIRSVKNIGQVTRALEAVSASKVRWAQSQVQATRPYAIKAWEVLVHLSLQTGTLTELHPLFEVQPDIKKASILLFTSDRGLCGAFNTNIVRKTLDFIELSGFSNTLVTVGRKGRDLMFRAGQNIHAEFTNIPDSPSILDITPIARTVIDDFQSGKVDVVFMAYMDFVNTLIQRPVVRRLLPLKPLDISDQAMSEYVEDVDVDQDRTLEYVYEPSPAALLDEIVPRFTELQIFQAVLESQASEQSARMVAMRSATENAEALAEELTLARNKARQKSITLEILDIAGGAEALAQALAAGR